jgi:hypothetical protein
MEGGVSAAAYEPLETLVDRYGRLHVLDTLARAGL